MKQSSSGFTFFVKLCAADWTQVFHYLSRFVADVSGMHLS